MDFSDRFSEENRSSTKLKTNSKVKEDTIKQL